MRGGPRPATRRAWTGFAAGLAVTLTAGLVAAAAGSGPARAQGGTALRPPEAFASIGDRAERSIAYFVESGKVFRHVRCGNCHPNGDRPRQGDDGRPHQPPVRRGADGDGVPGLRCASCHLTANYDATGMPGQPGWQLAPRSMALQGLSLSQLCTQLKDRNRNGGRAIADLVQHVAKDPLVIWAWAPGPGRQPAPGTPATFAALVQAWADTGAECPPS